MRAAGRWVLTGALLAVALSKAPVHEWLPYLQRVDYAWLAVAALMMYGIVLVNTYKWQMLLEVQGLGRGASAATRGFPGYLRLLYHYGVGYFFNSFITGSGDLKRAADLGAETQAPSEVFASVVAERWTGVIGQLTLASVTLLMTCWHYGSPLLPLLVFSGGLGGALVIAYLWLEDARPQRRDLKGLPGRALAWVHGLRVALSAYRHQRRVWWTALALSLVGPMLLVTIHWALTRALGVHPPFLALLLFVPTISVFAQLPITINGFGLQDYFMVTLLLAAMTPGQAMALSLAFHMLRLGVGATGGLLFVLTPDLGTDRRPVWNTPG